MNIFTPFQIISAIQSLSFGAHHNDQKPFEIKFKLTNTVYVIKLTIYYDQYLRGIEASYSNSTSLMYGYNLYSNGSRFANKVVSLVDKKITILRIRSGSGSGSIK